MSFEQPFILKIIRFGKFVEMKVSLVEKEFSFHHTASSFSLNQQEKTRYCLNNSFGKSIFQRKHFSSFFRSLFRLYTYFLKYGKYKADRMYKKGPKE